MSLPLSELCTRNDEISLVVQFVAGYFVGNRIMACKMTFTKDGP